MIPSWLTRPTAGLMPTTPLADEGQMMDPSVSVPTATGVRPAATATADPLEEPQGERSRTCGLRHWRPRALQPPDDRDDRKLAHSLRLVLPSRSMPAARRRATIGASTGAGAPASASDPAVVSMRSPVSMLSLTSTGTPCRGPRTRPSRRSSSSRSAISSQSGLSSMTERRLGPTWSMAAIRSRCISASRRTLNSPLSRRRPRSAIEASARSGCGISSGQPNARSAGHDWEQLFREAIELYLLGGIQSPQGHAAVLLDWHPSPYQQVLQRRLKRKPLYPLANLAQTVRSGCSRSAHDLSHRFREGRSKPGYGANGARRHTAMDQGLWANEDLEPVEQVGLESLPGAVRHLQPDQVGQPGAQLLDDGGLHGIAATRGELVDEEGQRRARASSRCEVFDEGSVVWRVVGRRYHRHRSRADLGRMRGELHRGGSRLCAAVDDHGQPPAPGTDKGIRGAAALGGVQEDALTGCAECQDTVHARGGQMLDQWFDRLQVDCLAGLPHRRHRCGNGTPKGKLERLRQFQYPLPWSNTLMRGRPSRYRCRFSMKRSTRRSFSCVTVLAECGEMMTFGIAHRTLSTGSGSFAKTSSAAPRRRPAWSISIMACSSMIEPRPTFTTTAWAGSRDRRRRSTRLVVSGVSGAAMTRMSVSGSAASNPAASTSLPTPA